MGQDLEIANKAIENVNRRYAHLEELFGRKIIYPFGKQVNIDNLIPMSNAESFNLKQKEEEELMRKKIERIGAMNNVRIRHDGRFEWRKTVLGISHQILESDPDVFLKRHSAYTKQLKKNGNLAKQTKPKESHKLIDLLWQNHNLYRVGKIKHSSSEVHRTTIQKHMSCLTKDIRRYTKVEIQEYLNNIQYGRIAQICYLNLKSVFAEAAESGIIPRNIIATLKKPVHKVDKGSWLLPPDQQKLMDNLPNNILGKEILFYIMTGARLTEAKHTTIDFKRRVASIERPKTEESGITKTELPLSKEFCDMIKDDWHKMFKLQKNMQGKKIRDFLESIGIYGKTTHDLRHTFSTNIYYLGVDPKKHQYLMAHTTLKMSYDVYTSLVPYIKKQDILKIYGNLYPKF